MILEGEFFSGSHLRWNLGWPTPNYAGACLVSLLALCFLFSGSRWRWAFLVPETVGLFLLAKTYSRGAVLAWVAAWLFGSLAVRVWREPVQRLLWMARVGILAAMMLAVGFEWSRATDTGSGTAKNRTMGVASSEPSTEGVKRGAATRADGSVVNRLALWRGGLQMIAAAPLSGWGAGESGRAYMNWYQDVERTEGYTTMVNSYLHVAVEYGLFVLAGVFFVLGWLLIISWRSANPWNGNSGADVGHMVAMGAGASLVAWSVANVFTTLWIEPKLWITPTVAALTLVWCGLKRVDVRPVRAAIVGFALSCIASGSLLAAGCWLRHSQPVLIAPSADGSVVFSMSTGTGMTWHVWPDPVVLGPTPGKELRRWLQACSPNLRLVVHRAIPRSPEDTLNGAEGVILFGRQVERIGSEPWQEHLHYWIVHPTVPPPALVQTASLSPATGSVILPQIDEIGNGPAWRLWGKEVGASVRESPGSGLDIRMAWLGVMKETQAVRQPVQAP